MHEETDHGCSEWLAGALDERLHSTFGDQTPSEGYAAKLKQTA
ncbi:MAG: hypothetical protein QF921_13125 [Pseudomonadales bacterium]|nr:hypothetical protein [Pseudomonadales bacterium]MDP6469787.1 hypothetical protein [Pseudomonadales bacterium]MDP6827610.1 hypothetical protein [Pseudomonadales bacterium]MDP6972431.1 hypothetical protein [Pseudomonadales bacterium]